MMPRQLAIITLVLFLPLAFGQSKDNKLWKADDPRTANPLNLYQHNNPLNPANKFRSDNDLNPVNRFKLDNPLNPVNKYNLNNMLNPTNRFHPDSPLNPVNRYRSADNPPTEFKSYTPYTAPQYEVPGNPLDSLLDDLWEDTPY